MSGSFVAASNQYLLRSSAPVSAAPFTMACWARPTFAGNGGGNQGAISIANSSTGFSQWTLGVDGVPEWWIRRDETSSNLDELDVPTGIVANTWQFALAQITAANNVRLYVLNANGTVSQGQSTNSRTPAGINSMVIGSPGDGTEIGNSSFDGLIAEAWVANIDVWPGGGAAPDWFIRWLAMNGPFARADIARAVVEYRGLRNTLTGYDKSDVFWRGAAPAWTNVNGVTRNAAPPLVLPRTRQFLKNRPLRMQEDLLNLWVPAAGGSVSGVAAFAGTGALSVVGAKQAAAAATIAGTGALAAIGAKAAAAAATIAGTGTFAGAGKTAAAGAATIAGTGALAAVGADGAAGAAAFIGSGVFAAVGATGSIVDGVLTMTGNGSFAAVGAATGQQIFQGAGNSASFGHKKKPKKQQIREAVEEAVDRALERNPATMFSGLIKEVARSPEVRALDDVRLEKIRVAVENLMAERDEEDAEALLLLTH